MGDLVIFSSTGVFQIPSDEAIAALPDERRMRFECVRLAHADCEAVANTLAKVEAAIENDLTNIAALEKAIKKFPQPTFLELHRAAFSGPDSRHPGKW